MTASHKTPQFSLRALLIFVTIAAIYCAVFSYEPALFILLAVLGGYTLAVWAKVGDEKIASFGMLALCLITLVAMLLMMQVN